MQAKGLSVVAVFDVFEIVLIIVISIEAFFILRGWSEYLNGVSKKFFALAVTTALCGITATGLAEIIFKLAREKFLKGKPNALR